MTKEEFVLKHGHFGYTEIIILKNGEIEYSIPSHINKLIELSGKTKDELNKLMPILADQISWLCDYTNCVAVWYNCAKLPHNFTNEQKETIEYLSIHNLISGDGFSMIRNYEKDRCEKLSNHDIDNIIDVERYTIENNKIILI